MKLTKSQLKQVIKEELGEVFESVSPIPRKQKETPDPTAVLNNIRGLWPTKDSGDREKVKALKGIWDLVGNALVGDHEQPGLLNLKQAAGKILEYIPPSAGAGGVHLDYSDYEIDDMSTDHQMVYYLKGIMGQLQAMALKRSGSESSNWFTPSKEEKEDIEEAYSEKQRKWACAQTGESRKKFKGKLSLSKKEAEEMCKDIDLKKEKKK